MSEFAFRADRSAVREDDMFGDSEAETCAAGFAGAGFIHAIEALEEARQMFGGDAGAKVLYVKFDAEFNIFS